MAEFVQQRTEHMIAELPVLYSHFSKTVVKRLLKHRQKLEYKLMRRNVQMSDFNEYITFLKFIIRRVEKMNTNSPESQTLINQHRNRIISIYHTALKSYKHKVSLWIEYIKFLNKCNRFSLLQQALDSALLLHGQTSDELYVFAVRCEFVYLQSIQKTRETYTTALRIHTNSSKLHLIAFECELDFSQQLSRKLLKSGKEINADDPALNGTVAKIIFESAVENLKDNSSVFFKMYEQATLYDLSKDLSNEIKSYMFATFSKDPNYWDTLAKNELTNKSTTIEKLRVKNCLDRYDEALTIVDSDEMWDKYLNTILQLTSDNEYTEMYKRNLLRQSMFNAHDKKKLKPEHYVEWINKSTNCMAKEILPLATERFPDNLSILELKVNKLVHTDKFLVYKLFKDNANKFSPGIWLVMAECYSNEPQIKEIFDMAFGKNSICGKEIKQKLGNSYISWLYKNRSLNDAREAYNKLMISGTCDVSLCKTLVDIEVKQTTVNIAKIRMQFTLACMQFGKTNIDLWMDQIRFEVKYGSPKLASNTYHKAITTLNNEESDKFAEEYALKAQKFNQL